MEKITLDRVEGLVSIFNFNSQNRIYQDFLMSKELLKKSENYRISRCAGNIFKDFVKEYLRGLKLRASNECQNILISEDEIHFLCQEINPLEEKFIHRGYEPHLNFFATPKELMVKSYLIRYNSPELKVLEDLLKLSLEKKKINKMTLSFRQDELGQQIIDFASIEQIPNLINRMEEIYKKIGKRKIKTLSKLIEKKYLTFSKESKKKLEKEYYSKIWDTAERGFFIFLPKNF